MSDELLFVLMVLTTFRITWLITRDSFPPIRWLREQIIAQHNNNVIHVRVSEDGHRDDNLGAYVENRGPWEWAYSLVTCNWCVSVWVAAFVTLFTWLIMPNMQMPLWWFVGAAGGAALTCAVVNKLES